MQSNMTWSSAVALFSAMLILAGIPSLSVLAVITRSATFGFVHGVLTSLGILTGDIIFILVAIGGLSLLVSLMGTLFVLIKYLGGTYLIFLGIQLCRLKPNNFEYENGAQSSLLSSFLSGLLITLADQKATLFYLGFFPAFIDISKLTKIDIVIIIGITTVAVGGVKLGYAIMADRARFLMKSHISQYLNKIAGGVMIAVGVLLMIRQ